MLQKVSEVLTPLEQIDNLISSNWAAICPETGAFLDRSNGRRMSGRPARWMVILPTQTPQERGGLLASYEANSHERKIVEAFTLEEVLPKANVVLDRMLAWRVLSAQYNDLGQKLYADKWPMVMREATIKITRETTDDPTELTVGQLEKLIAGLTKLNSKITRPAQA